MAENIAVGLEANLDRLDQGLQQGMRRVQEFGLSVERLPAPKLPTPTLSNTDIDKALDGLSAKLRVAQGNAEIFGNQFQADKLKIVAYTQALNQLLASGLNPTSKEVLNLANNIELLGKKTERQQGILDRQAQRAAQALKPQEGILQNLQRNADLYRQKMLQATDTKSIDNYRQTVKNLEHQIAQLTGRTTALGRANQQAAQQANKLSGSANMVGMEFARIIQDAPFGMAGIGNNIQQLSANFGQLRAQAGSTGGAMKAALAGLVSPASLLTIGIAALTSGFVLYQQWQQKSAKATKEGGEAMKSASAIADEYIGTLDALGAARVRGEQDAQKELTTLQLLYKRTQGVSLSLGERKKAVDEIQKQYPSYFKGISDEEILAGNASAAYDKLTNSLIANAKARAAIDLIGEKAREQLINSEKIADLRKKEIEAERKYNANLAALAKVQEKLRQSGDNSQAGADTLLQGRALQEQNALIAERQKLELENIALGEDMLNLEKLITTESLLQNEGKGKKTKEQLSALQELEKAFNQANREAQVYGNYQEQAAVKVKALQTAINRLLSEGIHPSSQAIQELKLQIQGLDNVDLSNLQNTFELFASKVKEDLSTIAKDFKPKELKLFESPSSQDFFAQQAAEATRFFDLMEGRLISVSAAVTIFFDKMATEMQQAQAMAAIASDFAGNAFSALGQGLGDMFQGLASGANMLANVGKALLQTVSQLAMEFGRKLLAIGIGESLLGIPTGALKIAAGAALITAAGIGGSFANARPSGGVGGPSASVTGTGGAFQPQYAGSGAKEVTFRIQGRDLVGLMEGEQYYKGRVRGGR